MSANAAAPTRIVILGGGPAGVAAAYWLSAPEQQGKYQVSLYVQGWRLGGKCASGRNQAAGNRIEEHGLHLLMGCYQNGFATMRRAYLDWRAVKKDPNNPFQIWSDAFLPQRLISLMEQDGPGDPASWSPWNFPCPPTPGNPGDGPLVPGSPDHVGEEEPLILMMSDWLQRNVPSSAPFYGDLQNALFLFDEVIRDDSDVNLQAAEAALAQTSRQIRTSLDSAERGIGMEAPLILSKDALPPSKPTGHAEGLIGKVEEIIDRVEDAVEEVIDEVKEGIDHLVHGVERIMGSIRVGAEGQTISEDIGRIAILADLGIAIARGFLNDIFLHGPGAYDAINGKDFRGWLKRWGASDAALQSGPGRCLYDLAFSRNSIAAGVGLRVLKEMVFGYRNAPLFKMAAGMGDTVFTPFYDILTARGVSINFFSRVTAMRPSGPNALGEIDVSTQATTVNNAPYRPLVPVTGMDGKTLDCWPNQPDWTQLNDGAALQAEGADFEYSGCTISTSTTTLVAGQDFDIAISAMPPDSLQPVATALINANTAWKKALADSDSTATQSLQLWMKPDLEGLGWTEGSTILTSFTEPYDSWGDMSQVIARESWAGPNAPGSIGYFCGSLETTMGPVTLPEMEAAVTGQASVWLTNSIQTLWPSLEGNPLTNPAVLGRYDLANFDQSDRYVLTPAGPNVASRFDPSKPAGFANLYAIGDWTKTRFSAGCFESAIESAMLASRGISGFPQDIKTG